jgi:tetratricopeptide (TPR) repeat protein
MTRDAQGHAMTAATPEAARRYDAAVRAFCLAYDDPAAHLDAAMAEAPAAAMPMLAKGWLLALSNDPAGVASARALAEKAAPLAMDERERAHHAALVHAAASRWASAVAILDRHLMAYPRDLMAHQVVMRLDGFLGRFHLAAPRSARALPLWSRDTPGYAILLSFLGFGLEEQGDYARSEDVSRQAAELEPYGYWPHHAVSHVMEMTGRPAEGLRWMAEREPLWNAKENTNRVHIHWHKALFHVELGEGAEALALYDGPILATLRPVGTSLCNGSALLWRLETMGVDIGDRWGKLAGLWETRADGRTSVFNDIHAAMALLRAGDMDRLNGLVAAMRQTAEAGAEISALYRDVGLPVVAGLEAFARGDDRPAVEHLGPVRFTLQRMGGSKAQRDVVEWTLAEASIRAGMRDVALALAHERLASRPASVPNRRFLAEAERIAA